MEYIRNSAFANCENLKYVVLSKNTKVIEEGSFVGTDIKEIVFPASLQNISDGGALLGLTGATIKVESGMNADILAQINKTANVGGFTVVQN